jgi:spermidine synthase
MHKLWILIAVQATVAAASLVVEIVAGRMLAPYVGMSLYTWTSIIAVVLAGFSAGHWAGGRLAELPVDKALRANGWAMLAAALTTGGALFLLRGVAGPVITAVDHPVAAIVVLTVLVFFLPSFFAGIPAPILSHVAVLRHPDRAGRALGAMFAAGAWGAILGTLAAGFVFIAWLGSTGTLVVVTVVYAALGLHSLWAAQGMGRWLTQGATAALVPLVLAGATLSRPDPCLVESNYFCIRVVDQPGEDLVRYMVLDHLVHGVSVAEDARAMIPSHGIMLDGLSRLRMDGRTDWSAFLIGGGNYALPRAWAAHDAPVDVTVAEMDPEVTRIAAEHFWFDPATAHVIHADARRVLHQQEATYDIVIGDAFTDIAVPEHLITQEFFALVNTRLNPGGAYVMNVIDHMDRLEALASIVATARQVFDVVEIWADPLHDPTEDRRVFIMVAGDAATPVSRFTHIHPEPRQVVRVEAASIDALVARDSTIVLTDDFVPIARLMGARS